MSNLEELVSKQTAATRFHYVFTWKLIQLA
jgi:hypothetical protein